MSEISSMKMYATGIPAIKPLYTRIPASLYPHYSVIQPLYTRILFLVRRSPSLLHTRVLPTRAYVPPFVVQVRGADIVFVTCVTWPAKMMEALTTKLGAELQKGAKVVTLGRSLPSKPHARFVEVRRGEKELNWGVETFHVMEGR